VYLVLWHIDPLLFNDLEIRTVLLPLLNSRSADNGRTRLRLDIDQIPLEACTLQISSHISVRVVACDIVFDHLTSVHR
jgi:hypothetical protein